MEYEYKILESSNYDGDSFDLTIDLGFDIAIHRKCRIYGIDTPELRGGDDRSKAAGRLAKEVARKFVAEAMERGGAVFLSTNYSGKFGRPLGDIQRRIDGVTLTQHLLEQHLAVPYKGEAKSKVAEAHARNIAILVSQGKIQ